MSKKFLLGSVPQVVEGTTSWRDFCNSKCLFNDSRVEDIRSGCAMYTVKADGCLRWFVPGWSYLCLSWIFLQVLYGSKLKHIYLNYSFIRTHGLVERIAGSVTFLAYCCCWTAKRNARSDNGSQNRWSDGDGGAIKRLETESRLNSVVRVTGPVATVGGIGMAGIDLSSIGVSTWTGMWPKDGQWNVTHGAVFGPRFQLVWCHQKTSIQQQHKNEFHLWKLNDLMQ